MHRRPGPVEVYKLLPQTNCRACGQPTCFVFAGKLVAKLLPQTNCKACGQPTCFVFAGKLVAGHVKLEDCPVLGEPQYAGQRAKLAELLNVDLPAIGSRER